VIKPFGFSALTSAAGRVRSDLSIFWKNLHVRTSFLLFVCSFLPRFFFFLEMDSNVDVDDEVGKGVDEVDGIAKAVDNMDGIVKDAGKAESKYLFFDVYFFPTSFCAAFSAKDSESFLTRSKSI